MKKSDKVSIVLQITKINLRYNFSPLLGLAFAVMLLVPILFGVTNLDSKAAAMPLEMILSILGIILLVPLFQPEQNHDIEDIITSKYIDLTYVHLIRAVYTLISLTVLVTLFSLFMLFNGCEISINMIFGTVADAIFLGSIGLFAAAITNNLTVSFMPPVIYYALNVTMRRKFGMLNVFSMMDSNYEPDIWLFVTGILIIAASLGVKRIILKRR